MNHTRRFAPLLLAVACSGAPSPNGSTSTRAGTDDKCARATLLAEHAASLGREGRLARALAVLDEADATCPGSSPHAPEVRAALRATLEQPGPTTPREILAAVRAARDPVGAQIERERALRAVEAAHGSRFRVERLPDVAVADGLHELASGLWAVGQRSGPLPFVLVVDAETGWVRRFENAVASAWDAKTSRLLLAGPGALSAFDPRTGERSRLGVALPADVIDIALLEGALLVATRKLELSSVDLATGRARILLPGRESAQGDRRIVVAAGGKAVSLQARAVFAPLSAAPKAVDVPFDDFTLSPSGRFALEQADAPRLQDLASGRVSKLELPADAPRAPQAWAWSSDERALARSTADAGSERIVLDTASGKRWRGPPPAFEPSPTRWLHRRDELERVEGTRVVSKLPCGFTASFAQPVAGAGVAAICAEGLRAGSLAEGPARVVLPWATPGVLTAALDREASSVAFVTSGKQIRLWRPRARELSDAETAYGGPDVGQGIAFDPEGRLWAVGERTLHELDAHGRKLAQHPGGGLFAISPDGKRIASWVQEGPHAFSLKLLARAGDRVLAELPPGEEGGWGAHVAFSPDGARLIVSGEDCAARDELGPDTARVALCVRDVPSLEPVAAVHARAPVGQLLGDGRIVVVDGIVAKDGKLSPLHGLPGAKASAAELLETSIVLAPARGALVFSAVAGGALVWREDRDALEDLHDGGATARPDSRTIASYGPGSITLHDLDGSPDVRLSFDARSAWVSDPAADAGQIDLLGSPAGSTLACRIDDEWFPLELCLERFQVDGLAARLLKGDTSHRRSAARLP